MANFPIETHEFFNEYRKSFGIVSMMKLFGLAKTSVYRWCADPDTNGETRPNPLDKLEEMLVNLVDAGEGKTAERLVDRLAMITGNHLAQNTATPDKKILSDECLDDLPAIAKFHQAMVNKEPEPVVRDCHRNAVNELNEDLALYAEGLKI